jgi:hypothetical protein
MDKRRKGKDWERAISSYVKKLFPQHRREIMKMWRRLANKRTKVKKGKVLKEEGKSMFTFETLSKRGQDDREK